MGGRAHRQGHGAEWIAAAWLMLKGYQVLGFRLKTRAGEIDLLVRRGSVLAVVEVKRRRSMVEAQAALAADQYARLLAAGEAAMRHRPALKDLRLRIDMVALAPGRFPRHLCGVDRSAPGDRRIR
nr:YraN family protein [Brevundimonas sp. PAMC22021]